MLAAKLFIVVTCSIFSCV